MNNPEFWAAVGVCVPIVFAAIHVAHKTGGLTSEVKNLSKSLEKLADEISKRLDDHEDRIRENRNRIEDLEDYK